ncbi:uncharacterized protein [Clytia hemisphaerica]|uniref:Uncharacterized protein n=1 Tax=Clytia hemisphaerica TaxID=252671 RepID=A0A7M5TZ04_9CNID|eukprot:TCONS_00009517-protein
MEEAVSPPINSSVTMMPDFNAVLLPQGAIKELNTKLIPTDALARDVRSLADNLGFSNTDINYLVNKQYPFIYMYDQWLKRHKQDAKLKALYAALMEIRRPDAAEIVERVLKDLQEQDPKETMRIEERYLSTLQRSISCTTLALPESFNIAYERQQNFSQGVPVPQEFHKRLQLKDPEQVAPDVFVVYFPDSEKHVSNIVRFIKRCHKYGIDATTDIFDPKHAEDRGVYIYSRMVEAQFVFVVCSEGFFSNSEAIYKPNVAAEASAKGKEVSFIMKFILNEIYDLAGNNPKFIPVLFPHGKEDFIPSVLKSATTYKMPVDFDNLRRRVFGIEKYKLAPLPATRPKIIPKVIGAKKGFFR